MQCRFGHADHGEGWLGGSNAGPRQSASLRIGVDKKHAPTGMTEAGRQIDRNRRLSDTAFLIQHADDQ
ncbi:hypothetical protein M2323_001753 [Rhodoblastus acidophilus]|nr:hypothetical protein [Rhodoblastus acidophilus]MCW2332836.1 hypothetical protein [Rhodoblastus acidophilus]